jgi:hypothetical protein
MLHAQDTDYLFMIEQAVKAPSGHNTQPWLFKINDASIEIRPNYSKILPVVDADNRELFISLGCAAGNLCIAATEKGYESSVSIADSGFITVFIKKSNNAAKNSLLAQIPIRQTNRSVYTGRKISADTIGLLRQMPLKTNIRMYLYANGSSEFSTIKALVAKGNTLQMQDEKFTGELKSWMRFNKKQTASASDGLSYAAFGAPSLPAFISKPIISSFLTPEKQNKGDMEKIDSSSHAVLFTTQNNTVDEWINLGRYLQTFLLQTTAWNIANAYMNQPCELIELSEEMNQSLNLGREHPAILIRIGYAAHKMPYSMRKNIMDVIITE